MAHGHRSVRRLTDSGPARRSPLHAHCPLVPPPSVHARAYQIAGGDKSSTDRRTVAPRPLESMWAARAAIIDRPTPADVHSLPFPFLPLGPANELERDSMSRRRSFERYARRSRCPQRTGVGGKLAGAGQRRYVVSLGVSHGEDATTIVSTAGAARCVAFMATGAGRINKDRVSRARTNPTRRRCILTGPRVATTGLAVPATDQLFRAEVSSALMLLLFVPQSVDGGVPYK
uniref:Uncharacterized protein n=1 Tax=Plectus sambesii TaxID=2011161 RepID=A0A914VRX1_9BILA